METKLKDSEIVAELIESVRHDMEMPKEIWTEEWGCCRSTSSLNGTRKLHKSTSRRRAAVAEKHIGQTNGVFTVRYPCGRLTLCLETFFPVTQKKARQLFRRCSDQHGSLENGAV